MNNPTKKIKISKESQVLKVDKILGKNKRLFCIEFTDKTFTYKINSTVHFLSDFKQNVVN